LKILAVSDMVVERLYTAPVAELFSEVDLILACGDLPYEYLEYLVTMSHVPVLYVPGNHDPQYDPKNAAARAEGCEHLDLKVQRVKGLNLAGLGGSIRYKPASPNQYSQAEMYLRTVSLSPKLLIQRMQTGRKLDIMIAHSPPFGINDDDDQAHIGFLAFRDLIRIYQPRYFLHGHTLVYKSNLQPSLVQVGSTQVINIYPYRLLEVDPNVR